MTEYTHGGFPAAEAYAWTQETYQALGSIVCDLVSGAPDRAIKAYGDYHELRRHFIADVFDAYLDKLDQWRQKIGRPAIRELIEKVSYELIEYKKALPCAPDSPELPPFAGWTPVKAKEFESAEQLSLF